METNLLLLLAQQENSE